MLSERVGLLTIPQTRTVNIDRSTGLSKQRAIDAHKQAKLTIFRWSISATVAPLSSDTFCTNACRSSRSGAARKPAGAHIRSTRRCSAVSACPGKGPLDARTCGVPARYAPGSVELAEKESCKHGTSLSTATQCTRDSSGTNCGVPAAASASAVRMTAGCSWCSLKTAATQKAGDRPWYCCQTRSCHDRRCSAQHRRRCRCQSPGYALASPVRCNKCNS